MSGLAWLVLTNWDPSHTEDSLTAWTSWHRLSSDWRTIFPEQELSSIEFAAYVVTISRPFTVDYPKRHSPVLYIGEGFAHARFKEHLREKLLPLLQTFEGAKFDFWVLPCTDKNEVVVTEAHMLAYFHEQHGARPLFNVQAGKTAVGLPHPAWAEPLDGRRRGKREWAIRRLV